MAKDYWRSLSDEELQRKGAEEARCLIPLESRRSHQEHMRRVRMNALKKQEGKR